MIGILLHTERNKHQAVNLKVSVIADLFGRSMLPEASVNGNA